MTATARLTTAGFTPNGTAWRRELAGAALVISADSDSDPAGASWHVAITAGDKEAKAGPMPLDDALAIADAAKAAAATPTRGVLAVGREAGKRVAALAPRFQMFFAPAEHNSERTVGLATRARRRIAVMLRPDEVGMW